MSPTDFTPEEIEQFEEAAAEAERGYSIEFLRSRPSLGRPREIGDEVGVVIQFRLDPNRVSQLDERAQVTHRTRSQIIREALDHELARTA